MAITVSILRVYLDLDEYHSTVKTETMHEIAEPWCAGKCYKVTEMNFISLDISI